MSQFLYIYRSEPAAAQASPAEMQERMKSWMTWLRDLEAKGHIVDRGQPLPNAGGAVVKDAKGTFSDGPYAEAKDIVVGFSLIEAKDLQEAIKLSVGCPLLVGGGGLVEVRPIMQM